MTRPDPLTLTLLSCVQTSLRLLSSRQTPRNAALAERYRTLQVTLGQDIPLQPAQITLLQRSVVSSGALADIGGHLEGPPSSVTPNALARAQLALHARARGAGVAILA